MTRYRVHIADRETGAEMHTVIDADGEADARHLMEQRDNGRWLVGKVEMADSPPDGAVVEVAALRAEVAELRRVVSEMSTDLTTLVREQRFYLRRMGSKIFWNVCFAIIFSPLIAFLLGFLLLLLLTIAGVSVSQFLPPIAPTTPSGP